MIKSSNSFLNKKYNLSETELMDKIAMVVIECLKDTSSYSFKGGWVLSKIYPNNFRRTCDVDMSINSLDVFFKIESGLIELCEDLMSSGEIHNYKIISPNPDKRRSGGVKMYRLTPDGRRYKVSGLDVSVKDLKEGVSLLKIGIPIFSFERMMSDKLKVLFSDSCVRRVKDIFDCRLIIDRIDIDEDELRRLCKFNKVNFNSEYNAFSIDLKESIEESWNYFIIKSNIELYKDLDENLRIIYEWLEEVGLIE